MSILRLDTVSVTIHAAPKKIWDFIADVRNWQQFSDFSKNMEPVNDREWVAHTDQDDIYVHLFFDEQHLTLDQAINLPNGDEQLIPYRIIPKGDSCELMMTNQQTSGVSDAEYTQQMGWIQQELETVKEIMESSAKS